MLTLTFEQIERDRAPPKGCLCPLVFADAVGIFRDGIRVPEPRILQESARLHQEGNVRRLMRRPGLRCTKIRDDLCSKETD